MPPQKLYKPPGLILGTDMVQGRVSDHSRSPIQKSVNRIEESKRMANGTLRKFVTATKHEWNVSWELLPHTRIYTVDGFMGANELEEMYESTIGAFSLIVVTGQLATTGDFVYAHPADATPAQRRSYKATQHLVHFTDFSKELESRGNKYDMYNVSMRLEEI